MYGSRVDRGICGLLMDEVHEVSRRDQASWPDFKRTRTSIRNQSYFCFLHAVFTVKLRLRSDGIHGSVRSSFGSGSFGNHQVTVRFSFTLHGKSHLIRHPGYSSRSTTKARGQL